MMMMMMMMMMMLTLCVCRFTSQCRLDPDGEVTCIGCPEGYVGRRCERCAEDYEGRPDVPGGSCRFRGGFSFHVLDSKA